MSRLLYILSGIALAAAIGMTPSAKADNERGSGGFIGRDSRIAGCIAIVDDVRNGVMTPTEWLEANEEEFRDLHIELKKRKYSQTKAKDMMMGMAISLCMERKGYSNKCIADSDNEDADLQVMQTAPIYSCWSKRRTAKQDDKEGASAPSSTSTPSQSQTVIINNNQPPVVIQQAPPVVVPPPPPPVPHPVIIEGETVEQPIASMALPRMSSADMAQFNEDVSIISQPVRIIGDDEGGKKEARFGNCFSYWQSLHHNRTPEARQVLFAVRVARCMYRTNYAVIRTRADCQWEPSAQWQRATNILLSSRCYARF